MAKRKGDEVRKVVSVRIEPTIKEAIIEEFGSVQNAVDFLASLVSIKDKEEQ